MSPVLYVPSEHSPSPVKESQSQPQHAVHQNGFHKIPSNVKAGTKLQPIMHQNTSHSYCLRWIVRISKWYPSTDEWDFLLQLLPANESRKVQQILLHLTSHFPIAAILLFGILCSLVVILGG